MDARGTAENNGRSYKSEQKVSIAFATAFASKTMRQRLINMVFFQSEFGIRAGRLKRSRRLCHMMKAGIRARLSTRRTMFVG